MSRVLLLTGDDHLGDVVSEVSRRRGWDLSVRAAVPAAESGLMRFDLVMIDVRPAPGATLAYATAQPMTIELTGPIRAGRVLALGHHEDLLGRMNTFVYGGSVYLRIHPFGDTPDPNLDRALDAAMTDALALPPYRRVDFHDGFPDREFYRDASESIQIPIVILTNDGTIKLMNLRALARFDYETQLVIDQKWSMLIAPSDRGQRADEFLMWINSGHYYEGTLRCVDRHGVEFPALITSGRVFSASERFPRDLYIALTIHDLTEMEALQRQLTAFQRMESVERVVAGLTHEFNNMLTAILGHAELLTEDLPPGTEVHGGAEVIRREAERAQDLTSRLLGLSSSRQFLPGPVSCREVVQETVALLRHSLGDRVGVQMDLLDSHDVIEGEASQLRQVLVNLCLNARDAIEGRGVISIRTCVREITPEECRLHQDWTPGIFVETAVGDNGCGMTPDVLERVFEPFYTTKADGAGTGLGLSVVRGIVRNHGGHVAIESAPGRGTTVMVRLPQSEPAVPASAPEGEPAASTRSAPRGQGILVVDDDRAVLTFAQKVLERAGYRVRLALSGRLALDHFDRHRDELSLIILDLTMPETDGRDVVTRIRARDGSVPIIVCTGFAPGGLDEDLVRQVQGFLRKPYRPRDLLEHVSEVLQAAGPN